MTTWLGSWIDSISIPCREESLTRVRIWWEDKKLGSPALDWQGRKYDPENGPAAHPNSRFTVSATNNAKEK